MNLFDILNKESRSFSDTGSKQIQLFLSQFNYNIYYLKYSLLYTAKMMCKENDWKDVFVDFDATDSFIDQMNMQSIQYISEGDYKDKLGIVFTDPTKKLLYGNYTQLFMIISVDRNNSAIQGFYTRK